MEPHSKVSQAKVACAGGVATGRQVGSVQACLGILVVGILLCQVGLFFAGLPKAMHGYNDFRVFYATGRLIATHKAGTIYRLDAQQAAQRGWISARGPVLPFLYPPIAGMLFLPLAWMPFRMAFGVWSVFNFGLLCIFYCWVKTQLSTAGAIHTPLALLLAFGSIPLVIALLQGQLSILLLLSAVWIYQNIIAGRDKTAGVMLALLLVKFQFALPIVGLMLFWKRWRLILGFLLGAGCLSLASLAMVGGHGCLEYLNHVLAIAHSTTQDPTAARAAYGMFPADMPNLRGMAYVLFAGHSVSLWVTLVLSCLLAWWGARRSSGLPVALCIASLVSFHFQAYDLTILMMPLTVAISRWLTPTDAVVLAKKMQRSRFRWNAIICTAILLLLTVPLGAVIVSRGASWMLAASSLLLLFFMTRVTNTSEISGTC